MVFSMPDIISLARSRASIMVRLLNGVGGRRVVSNADETIVNAR